MEFLDELNALLAAMNVCGKEPIWKFSSSNDQVIAQLTCNKAKEQEASSSKTKPALKKNKPLSTRRRDAKRYDQSASMVAGSIIGGLIALCIVIAIVIVVVHACNCCKTHGIRGHTIRQTPIATVTSRAPYSTPLHNNWSYIPPTAPPYQPLVTKPPQYTSSDVNPPPAYEDISVSSPPSNTTFQGISSPASPCPPYSEMRS
ncbi:unnamed protein product [Mytilus edulis]|uniref:Uncharacterized protein n=1 Tax=Mytilus edulis TaxID=6550 RepID=A0A8S3QPP7_MYTED|nr:unnamed protein product [Mytilus edulis]